MEKSGYLTKDASGHMPKAEIELLFGNLGLIAGGTGRGRRIDLDRRAGRTCTARNRAIGIREAAWIGAVQGLCLPFRGFSRSGATISTGLLLGAVKARVEEFSFALAVIITPAAIAREVWRLIKAQHEAAVGRDMGHVRSQPVGHGSVLSWPVCWPSGGSPVGWRAAVGISSASIACWPRPSSLACTLTAIRRFLMRKHHARGYKC